MKKYAIIFFGSIIRKLHVLYSIYMSMTISKKLGKCGGNAHIYYPFSILGADNIYLEDGVSIGGGSTIFTTRAKVHIGKNTFSGPNLTIITGDHAFKVGTYMREIRKSELANSVDISVYDKDVYIDSDVWLGANITILKGVSIGRGAIVAAGALVVHDLPPYSISGSVPARVIKFKWSIEEILQHEKMLYPDIGEQLTREQVISLFNKYLDK